MSDRPEVRCLAAWMYGDGRILRNQIHHVTLAEAEQMKEQGFTIVGPDQHDLFELATWERARNQPVR